MTRRNFLGAAALAVGGGLTGLAAEPNAAKFYRGALLHLGSNMWGDFPGDPEALARSEAEEKAKPQPVNPSGRPTGYHNYLMCRDDLWRKSIDHMAAKKMNLVFIDLGEGVFYPSHPELAVAGTWSVEKMRAELARIRSLGMEPIPKLNFSTCHDAWLKNYHRMVSTPGYYKVVADVIADVCGIFDKPSMFHIGFDEEVPVAGKGHFHATYRQGDLWWHDLFYTVGQVERNGARAVMWSDKICDGRESFLERMPKSVLLSPWYYGTNFSEEKLKWDAAYEKKTGTWDVQRNLTASLVVLNDAGYDLLPCTSNWSKNEASDALVAFCKTRLDQKRLKGIYTAPWKFTIPDTAEKKNITKTLEGIDLFAAAMDRHYPLT
ncbi:MAG: twin-arginine translocation signal domain-containing protein [Kiritimatiellae bacterium]|nr:twin-arginine translocation signal domain-containing protein [Kiritimatiellia bacterium]